MRAFVYLLYIHLIDMMLQDSDDPALFFFFYLVPWRMIAHPWDPLLAHYVVSVYLGEFAQDFDLIIILPYSLQYSFMILNLN